MNGTKKWVVALACAAAGLANAGMVRDANGNVGFDTLAECDAAVSAGSATFYRPFSKNPPKLLNGATKVRQTTLRDTMQGGSDVMGYCSLGLARTQGRDGVSKVLQGKYVPLDANMEVNAYTNGKGELVSVRMRQCDNWMDRQFHAVRAKPVAVAPVAPKPVAPVVVPAPTPAPVAVAPTAVAPVAVVAPSLATPSWWWLAAPVVACAVLDCFDNDSGTTATTGTTGTTGSR